MNDSSAASSRLWHDDIRVKSAAMRHLMKRLAKLGTVAALGVFLAGLVYLSTVGNVVAEVSEGALFALGWGYCVWAVEQL